MTKTLPTKSAPPKFVQGEHSHPLITPSASIEGQRYNKLSRPDNPYPDASEFRKMVQLELGVNNAVMLQYPQTESQNIANQTTVTKVDLMATTLTTRLPQHFTPGLTGFTIPTSVGLRVLSLAKNLSQNMITEHMHLSFELLVSVRRK